MVVRSHLVTARSQANTTAAKQAEMTGMEAEIEPSRISVIWVIHAPPGGCVGGRELVGGRG